MTPHTPSLSFEQIETNTFSSVSNMILSIYYAYTGGVSRAIHRTVEHGFKPAYNIILLTCVYISGGSIYRNMSAVTVDVLTVVLTGLCLQSPVDVFCLCRHRQRIDDKA